MRETAAQQGLAAAAAQQWDRQASRATISLFDRKFFFILTGFIYLSDLETISCDIFFGKKKGLGLSHLPQI